MFSVTTDSFNNTYRESSIGAEIDAISRSFLPSSSLRLYNAIDINCRKHIFVCWHDQRRIAKCMLLFNNHDRCILFVRPRMEFILTYDFESFLHFLRDYCLTLSQHHTPSVSIASLDLSEGVTTLSKIFHIPGITWISDL